jgi:hypothetical protein
LDRIRAITPTTSAIRNAPHSTRTTIGRVEAVRRVGRAAPANAEFANKPVRKRTAHDIIPAMVDIPETLVPAAPNRVNSKASAAPEPRQG